MGTEDANKMSNKIKRLFSFSEILARINWFVKKQEDNTKN